MADVSMGPATVNIAGIRAGDKNLFTMTIKENGQPLNLDNMDIQAQVRSKPSDVNPSLEAVIEIIDEANGKISIQFPGSEVMTLLGQNPTWAGVWDLQLLAPDGATTICQGTFAAVMDITR